MCSGVCQVPWDEAVEIISWLHGLGTILPSRDAGPGMYEAYSQPLTPDQIRGVELCGPRRVSQLENLRIEEGLEYEHWCESGPEGRRKISVSLHHDDECRLLEPRSAAHQFFKWSHAKL